MKNYLCIPNLTATEPSKQISARRKKQNVGQRRPHLNNQINIQSRYSFDRFTHRLMVRRQEMI